MEEQNLFNASATSRNNGYYGNPGWIYYCVDIGQFMVKKYLCPADTTVPGHIDVNSSSWYGPTYATGGYAGNVMVFDPAQHKTVITAMPDGCSNTVMLGHRLEYCDGTNLWGISPGQGIYTDWDATPDQTGTLHPIPGFGYPTYYARRGNPFSAINQAPPWGLSPLYEGAPDYTDPSSGGVLPTSGIPFQVQPTSGNCDPGVIVSPHTAVMIAGLGDGSVRTVAIGITTASWWMACVPDDGGVLGNDW